jgi:hypothetical protein
MRGVGDTWSCLEERLGRHDAPSNNPASLGDGDESLVEEGQLVLLIVINRLKSLRTIESEN